MRPFHLPLLMIATLATACTQSGAPASSADAAPVDGPMVRVVGDPVTCIDRLRIRATPVRSDRVIDFEMDGGTVYRNTLPNSCPQLGLERAFTYSTSIGQLCNVDIISVLQRYGDSLQRGASCGLGTFVPVEYARPGGPAS